MDGNSDYQKDHSPKRGNKIGVTKPTPGSNVLPGKDPLHVQDIARGNGQSGMNAGEAVKDVKHNPKVHGLAREVITRGRKGEAKADGNYDAMPSNQHIGHKSYHKPNATARANGFAMWQDGVDSKHDENGEHEVPNQHNNQ